jgi:hypothetical protein
MPAVESALFHRKQPRTMALHEELSLQLEQMAQQLKRMGQGLVGWVFEDFHAGKHGILSQLARHDSLPRYLVYHHQALTLPHTQLSFRVEFFASWDSSSFRCLPFVLSAFDQNRSSPSIIIIIHILLRLRRSTLAGIQSSLYQLPAASHSQWPHLSMVRSGQAALCGRFGRKAPLLEDLS